ncbi:MAG: ABC-F family ATP-binding cassette domain-containing protein [Chloroflexi bacterium]|nr:ABC-F family ATP-binding cassette domain-containing protein [Chloroflexota bacterium]
MITLTDLTMRFGGQLLYEGASWQLRPGGHYGLVGANGSGKSTLLRLMTGELTPDVGSVVRSSTLRLGALGQDQFRFDEMRLIDVVLVGRPELWAAIEEKTRLLGDLGDAITPAAGERLAELELTIAELHGYEAEPQAAALLVGLGIEHARHERSMRELSGGFRLRVLLAQALFGLPDVLLLDEPTNHLDIASIQWLEGYLRDFPGAFVVVSHDRHFLNAICDTIADLDYLELRLYSGNYDAFERAKALAVAQKDAEIARTEERIEEMQEFIDRFRAKATKARQASARKKQVEKIEMPEIRRSSRRAPGFAFQQSRPSGRIPLRVAGLTKRYGEQTVLRDVSFELERGDRLAVVGPNGVGKSTLIKIVSSVIEADEGVAELGYETHLGYFAQDVHDELRGGNTAFDWLGGASGEADNGKLRAALGRVLFSGDDVHKRVDDLSGGESARLLLSALMLRQPNLLVLDEPTNHLDLEGREALMRALRDYPGTLVFVSHDRHFVAGVGTRVLVLRPDGFEDVAGTYEQYLDRLGDDFLTAGIAAPRQARSGEGAGEQPARHGGGKHGYAASKEQGRRNARLTRRVAELELEIAEVEAQLAPIAARFSDNGYYSRVTLDEIRADEGRQRELQTRLDAAMHGWEAAAHDLEALEALETPV